MMIMTDMPSTRRRRRPTAPVEAHKMECKTASRVVSPDNSDSGCFWIDYFGSLQESLCGLPANDAIESPANIIVEEYLDDSPRVGLRRTGSFRRKGSHEDLQTISRSSSGDSHQRRRWRRQVTVNKNRETSRQGDTNSREEKRDPSPSLENNSKSRCKGSFDIDREKGSDTPLLIDPPDTRQRARSVPLEKLLNSRKDRGGNDSSTHQSLRSVNQRIRAFTTGKSSSVGGVRGDASTHTNNYVTNVIEGMSVDSFALKHDEVVTALIDHALQASDDDDSCSTSNVDKNGSPLRKRRQQGGMGSPYRKKIATPQWRRNRSRKLEGSVSSRGSGNTRVTNVNTSDFFHPKCVLHKEKGSWKDSPNLSNPPSAVGREACLEKLKEKLSLLSEIESGKYGKGADMLRSDAVAFAVQGYVGIDAVETRSILTVRMGFVSMNYGIVLQWDCASELAKQVVLVKMCRDDFLERNRIEFSTSAGHAVVSKIDIEEENSIAISDDSRSDLSPGRAFTDLNSSHDGQAYLSVSILNVKQLVPKCDHAHHKADADQSGFSWPWSRGTDPAPPAAEANPINADHSNIQPYVRFVFGRNQHITKSVKFNKGNITWNKRQRNSCLLPCPPEDQRWCAGQDDLVVEVRSRHKQRDDSTGGRFTPLSLFLDETTSAYQKRNVSDDPLLAAVTVPLSSIIFDEEDGNSTLDEKPRSALSRLAHNFKKHPSTIKDEPLSTNITLPLPMKCCSKAPFGSISLRITMKTPRTTRETDVPVPAVKHSPSPPRKKALQTKVDVSHQQVEGIELLPLTSLISSWVNDGTETNARNKNKAKMSKVMTWTKRYDPRTKKWSNLNGSTKRSRSFKNNTKQNEDVKPMLFQVVDRVIGKEETKKEEEQKQQKMSNAKPATNVIYQAGSRINETVHHVRESGRTRMNETMYQVRERKKSAGIWIDETVHHVRERKKSSRSKLKGNEG